MRELFDLHIPERYVVGTLGIGIDREFFIQARSLTRLITISIDESQANILAQSVNRILDELLKLGFDIPIHEPADLDLEPLEIPIETEFSAGAIGLAWNEATDLMTIELHGEFDSEVIPDVEENVLEGPPCLRVRLTAQDARNFVFRTERVVNNGKPVCHFCQLTMDAQGHICPRLNGYLRG